MGTDVLNCPYIPKRKPTNQESLDLGFNKASILYIEPKNRTQIRGYWSKTEDLHIFITVSQKLHKY